MSRASSQAQASVAFARGIQLRSSLALAGSLLLLGASYVLLVAAPLVFQRFFTIAGNAVQVGASGSWLPAAAACGLALGGGAAMVFVLGRLVQDVARRPYACLAPVLSVFSGFILVGLRAKLPTTLIASEYLGVCVLALAVSGGALMLVRGVLAHLAGWALVLAPSAALGAAVWAASGKTTFAEVAGTIEPAARVFLIILATTSFAMALIALVARSLARESYWAQDLSATSRDSWRLPRQNAAESAEAAQWENLRASAKRTAPPAPASTGLTSPGFDPKPAMGWSAPGVEQQPAGWTSPGFAQQPAAWTSPGTEQKPVTWTSPGFEQQPVGFSSPGFEQKPTTWDEDELTVLQRGTPRWLIALLVLAGLGLAGAAAWHFYFVPQRAKEQAARAKIAEQQQALQAAAARKVEAQRAEEASAAEARLRALLEKPADSAATGDAASAQPTATQPSSAPEGAQPSGTPSAAAGATGGTGIGSAATGSSGANSGTSTSGTSTAEGVGTASPRGEDSAAEGGTEAAPLKRATKHEKSRAQSDESAAEGAPETAQRRVKQEKARAQGEGVAAEGAQEPAPQRRSRHEKARPRDDGLPVEGPAESGPQRRTIKQEDDPLFGL